MKVSIKLFKSHLTVDEAGVTDTVKPGDKWRGWKYIRLRRLGDGEHDLVTRAEAKQKETGVLQIRGHK